MAKSRIFLDIHVISSTIKRRLVQFPLVTINHRCSSRSMRYIKITHLINMALHYYQRNGNPCYLQMVRMRIVLQNSIDSGTISLFYIFFTIWPRLTAVVSRCSQPTSNALSNIYPASDRLSRTHHPMIFFLFTNGNVYIFRTLSFLISLPPKLVSISVLNKTNKYRSAVLSSEVFRLSKDTI